MPSVSYSNMNCADNNMKILTISTLYPNNRQPRHGIFVETRMRKLKQMYPDCQITVIAPVPWFPFSASAFGDYKQYAGVNTVEERFGIHIYHPRYLALPGIGMYSNPWTLYLSLKNQVCNLLKQGMRFDIIDAHYIYPDAVAAVWLAQMLNLPITATARGSDITELPNYAWPRKRICKALSKVDAAIGVCQALVDDMQSLQPLLKHPLTIRNGVDTQLFYPEPGRDALRKQLGYNGFSLLSVGHLIERKGHDKIINLLAQLDDLQLHIAGDGPLEQQLRTQANRMGLSHRVHFIGHQSQAQLRQHYTAADCMVLASSREGWANVLLEAMACGCPVVATPAGGTPEVIAHPHAGIVSKDFSVEALLSALLTLKQNMPAREDVSAYARTLSWDQSIILLKQTFDNVLEQRDNSAAAQGEQHVR